MDSIYRLAAKVLNTFEKKTNSLKSLVFSSRYHATRYGDTSLKKKLYALTVQTIKHKAILTKVMENCPVLTDDTVLTKSRHLCMILLYDLLFGKGIQCGGPLKKAVTNHKLEIKAALKNVLEEASVHKKMDEPCLPRYARINDLKNTIMATVQDLLSDGYKEVEPDKLIQTIKSCKSKDKKIIRDHEYCKHDYFAQDPLIPGLLAFCPCAPLVQSYLYDLTHIIIQDKASCIPAVLLAPPPGSKVIDACAAPGNKTTHLASIMNNRGIIYAFDKDSQRFATLTTMIHKARATCVSAMLQDFLMVNPSEFIGVEYILVDPSCSGSGIVNRVDYSENNSTSQHRLKMLSNFQFKILKHALSFPTVKRVVYSTCSINLEENEAVVEKVLKEYEGTFRLVKVLPEWKNRGLPVFDEAENCIRASVQEYTNGFFVACFEHLSRKTTSTGICTNEDYKRMQSRVILFQQENKKRKKRRRNKKFPVNLKK